MEKDKLKKKKELKRTSKWWLSPAVISPGIQRHKVSPVILTVILLLLKLETQREQRSSAVIIFIWRKPNS